MVDLYENHFDPLNPKKNLLEIKNYFCPQISKPKYAAYLRTGIVYILLITTMDPLKETTFTIDVYGAPDSTFRRISKCRQRFMLKFSTVI